MIARLLRGAWRRCPRGRLRVGWVSGRVVGWHWARRSDVTRTGRTVRWWVGPLLVTWTVTRGAWTPSRERVSERWLDAYLRTEGDSR